MTPSPTRGSDSPSPSSHRRLALSRVTVGQRCGASSRSATGLRGGCYRVPSTGTYLEQLINEQNAGSVRTCPRTEASSRLWLLRIEDLGRTGVGIGSDVPDLAAARLPPGDAQRVRSWRESLRDLHGWKVITQTPLARTRPPMGGRDVRLSVEAGGSCSQAEDSLRRLARRSSPASASMSAATGPSTWSMHSLNRR